MERMSLEAEEKGNGGGGDGKIAKEIEEESRLASHTYLCFLIPSFATF
jgi:hypothetical protein